MAFVKEIITDIDKLTDIAQPIDVTEEDKRREALDIAAELKKTMRKKELYSLSAPAIGYNYQIFCVDFNDTEIKTFINPLIFHKTGLHLSTETCSSLPGMQFILPRHDEIDIYYQSIKDGTVQTKHFKGVAAEVIQHEIQHLEGLLICDYGLEVDDEFFNAPEDEQKEVIDLYIEQLKSYSNEVYDEIQDDEQAKIIKDIIDVNEAQAEESIRFIDAVRTGKIEIVPLEKDNNEENNE